MYWAYWCIANGISPKTPKTVLCTYIAMMYTYIDMTYMDI